MRIGFGPFEPDKPELDTGVTRVATNVFPGPGSFRPVPGPAPYSDALSAAPRGLWLARTTAGDNDVYAATQTTLEKLVGTAWTAIGSSLSVPTDDNWGGAQFGTTFYFTNQTDDLLSFDIEAGSAVAAVGGAAPNAKFLDVVGSYVMAGNLAADPGGVAWSDTEDGSTWSGGNSGGQSFKDGGHVVGILGAAHAIVQEYAIRDIIDDPGGDIFQFNKIEQAKGAIAPASVIRFGKAFGYLAEDGFWFAGEPIGQNKVNRYFLETANADQLFQTMGILDPYRPLLHWMYRTTATAVYDLALTYNWASGEWSTWEPDAYFAAAAATPGLTLEALSALYPDLETVPYSLDSRVWQGGRPVFAVIDADFKLAFLEGDNLEATIETGERNLVQGYRSRLLAAAPVVDTSAAVMAVRTRERLGDATVWSSEKSQQTSGVCKFNHGGRLHRFRLRVPAAESWTHAQGIEIPEGGLIRQGGR